jgi:hypothetical protein
MSLRGYTDWEVYVNDLRDVIRRFVKERNRERSHSPKMKIGPPRVQSRARLHISSSLSPGCPHPRRPAYESLYESLKPRFGQMIWPDRAPPVLQGLPPRQPCPQRL